MQHLPCPRRGVTGLTFSPDGDMLAGIGAGNDNTTLWCWFRSRNWEQTGIRHPGGISHAVFHPGGRTLAYLMQPMRSEIGENISEIRLYPLTSISQFDPGQLRVDRPPFSGLLLRLAFTPDGRTLLTSTNEDPHIGEDRGFFSGLFSRDQTVILHWHFTPSGGGWRVADATPGRTTAQRGAALVGANYLALAGEWGIEVCPLEPTAASLVVPDVSRERLVAAAPRGAAATANAERLGVWHLRTPEPLATWPLASWPPPPQPLLSALAFSPDGGILATGGRDQAVTFWDTRAGGRGSSFDFGVGRVQSLAYAPDGLTLAVAGHLGLVVVDVG